ncbi:energy transducer TonB [Jhaorihella thermophila]|uniref:Protein TonB n=1 Tax=Jhaorihella thermophila TaxID=488547 RepID=A0A1H5UNI9_9RHOB|nr:energy transducer TonB [Jhaorihella thermophila]SEF76632.1 protein TonB [Jhaorihella thermophila]
MRPAEAVIFLTLAAGLHVGAWQLAPRIQGTASDGGPGTARLTLAPATPRLAALARSWTRPPALGQAPQPAIAKRVDTPPDRPLEPIQPAARPVSQALAVVKPDPLPRSDRTTPAPPVPPEAATAAPPPPPAPVKAAQPPRLQEPARRPARPAPPARAYADKSRDAAPAIPAQVASGGGAPADRKVGKKGADKTQSNTSGGRDRLLAQWGARIQKKVHRRLIYPRGASGSGTARVALTVDRTGRLVATKLLRSAGRRLFDRAALNAVARAGRFPPAPKGLSRDTYTFTLSLAFRR